MGPVHHDEVDPLELRVVLHRLPRVVLVREHHPDDTVLEGAFVPDRYISRVVPAGLGGVDAFTLGVFAWAEPAFASIYTAIAERARDLALEGIKKKTSVAMGGRSITLTVFQTGIDASGKGAFLSLQGGATLSFSAVTRDVSDFGSKFAFASVPPGGGVVYRVNFYTDAAGMADKPTKFLLEIDPKSPLVSKAVRYTVPEPSFRVRLDCAR